MVQKDAFERLGLKQMLLGPEFLSAMEVDVHLVTDLVSLRSAMPDKTLDTVRQVIKKVVDELLKKLENKTTEAIREAVNKSKHTYRPRFTTLIGGGRYKPIYAIISLIIIPLCLRRSSALCVKIANWLTLMKWYGKLGGV